MIHYSGSDIFLIVAGILLVGIYFVRLGFKMGLEKEAVVGVIFLTFLIGMFGGTVWLVFFPQNLEWFIFGVAVFLVVCSAIGAISGHFYIEKKP